MQRLVTIQLIAIVRSESKEITNSDVLEDEAIRINECFIKQNLIFNYITTHHNKDTKLLHVYAHIKRDGVPSCMLMNLEVKPEFRGITWKD